MKKAVPILLILVGVGVAAAVKPIAKAMGGGLQERANMEGVLTVVGVILILAGIVLSFVGRK